jgi:uncharacterized membrane protein
MMSKFRDIQPEQAFLLLALIFGIAILFINPPFQAPDEQVHFYKSYALSDGQIIPEKIGNSSGFYIPKSTNNAYLEFRSIKFHPEDKINMINIFYFLNNPLHPNYTKFEDISNIFIVTYSPVPYLASGFAIFIGKLFSFSPLLLMYLGRIANLLFYALIVYMAIKITPVQKWVFFLLALMPMAIYIASSLSSDSFTIAISFLVIGLFFKFAFDDNKQVIDNKDLSILFILLLFIALSKQIYILLGLLFFMIPSYKFGNRKIMFLRFVSIFVPIMLVIIGWSFLVNGLYMPNSSAISVSGQIYFILANPLEFIFIVLNTILGNYHNFIVMFVGNFGRIDTPLPDSLIYIFIIVLSLVSILDKSRVNIVLKQKLIPLIILLIVFISVFALEFITWTPVGSVSIAGIQGRYFIPVAPLFFLLFFNKKFNYDLKYFNKTIIFFIILVLIFTLFVIFRRYYIF